MFKLIIILILVTYVLREYIFAPIPGSTRHRDLKNKKNKEAIEYTDYEEVDE